MPKWRNDPEIEIKLRVADLAGLPKRLSKLHARQILPRTHESNTLYDTPRRDLRRRGQLLRIRVERLASTPGKTQSRDYDWAILTYKAPFRANSRSQNASRVAMMRGRFKIREEAEVSVANADHMDRILRGLGLHRVFRYEKFRTTYALPGIPGVKVELDETPIGNYLELEGTTAGIDRAARLLGYAPAEYITATYGSLYLADCRRRRQKPTDMTFLTAKKLH